MPGCMTGKLGQLDAIHRADSRFAANQWKTALLCNDVSHWLGARLVSALYTDPGCTLRLNLQLLGHIVFHHRKWSICQLTAELIAYLVLYIIYIYMIALKYWTITWSISFFIFIPECSTLLIIHWRKTNWTQKLELCVYCCHVKCLLSKLCHNFGSTIAYIFSKCASFSTVKRLTHVAPNSKTLMFLVLYCSRLCPIHWSHVLSRE